MAYSKCSCGYETNDLSSCNQKECPYFKAIEVSKADEVLKIEISLATERYLNRVRATS